MLSVDDPSDDLFCAVNDESAMCNDVNVGEWESKHKVNAEDCGGEMKDISGGNVECATVSDNEDVDLGETLVLGESVVATDEFSGVLLSDVFGSDVINLIKETSDDGTLICSAQDHESKGEFVIDIGPVSYTHLTLPTIYSV